MIISPFIRRLRKTISILILILSCFSLKVYSFFSFILILVKSEPKNVLIGFTIICRFLKLFCFFVHDNELKVGSDNNY